MATIPTLADLAEGVNARMVIAARDGITEDIASEIAGLFLAEPDQANPAPVFLDYLIYGRGCFEAGKHCYLYGDQDGGDFFHSIGQHFIGLAIDGVGCAMAQSAAMLETAH